MKTSAIFGIVVTAHCVAIGAVLLIQGCGTVCNPEPIVQNDVIMPPPTAVAQAPAKPAPDAPVRVTQPVAPAFPPETTTYVVAKGDTLSGIAYKYELEIDDVMMLNGIKNKNMIRIGQKLVLPGKVAVDAPRKVKSKPEVTVAPGDGVYVVKAGDCLSKIAAACGVKTQALKDANDLTSNKIVVGQKLVIPGGNVPAAAATPSVAVPDAPVAPPVVDLKPPVVSRPTETVQPAPAPAPQIDASKYQKHTVQEGEDLYSVGLIWVVSVEELKRINNLTSTTLKPGQVILIPTE
ncbi:hypothetical protein BVX94_02740 [bacterium B17]|nr:hypothetical protein BVX94_02740 [bacterium B17]